MLFLRFFGDKTADLVVLSSAHAEPKMKKIKYKFESLCKHPDDTFCKEGGFE